MTQNEKTAEFDSMIDSGAGGMFIDQNFARKFKIKTLEKPIKVYNVDGTENKQGTIKTYVDLDFIINDQWFQEWLYLTRLGKQT